MSTPISESTDDERTSKDHCKPLVSLVIPAYNEEAIIQQSLCELSAYMESLEAKYRWEIIVVNDGSTDRTGEIAEAFAHDRNNIRVLHHIYNFRLGQALRYGFHHCRGDYVVTLDVDLSYAPDHIDRMLTTLQQTGAKIVVASPYMEGGEVSNVPWTRKMFSIWANRFLSLTVTRDRLTGKLSTLTGMVRAYDRTFLSKLSLKAMDVDINPEILYKAMILRGRIVEIPAHLNWRPPRNAGEHQRKSSMRILRSVISSLLSGFMFRPFMFFIVSGLGLLMLSFYAITRTIFHIIFHFQAIAGDGRLSHAILLALSNSPFSFLIGGFTLLLGVQLISLGFLALQNKKYFEELFYLGSDILNIKERSDE